MRGGTPGVEKPEPSRSSGCADTRVGERGRVVLAARDGRQPLLGPDDTASLDLPERPRGGVAFSGLP